MGFLFNGWETSGSADATAKASMAAWAETGPNPRRGEGMEAGGQMIDFLGHRFGVCSACGFKRLPRVRNR